MLPENWFNVIRENPQMFNYEEAIADHIIVYPISVQAKSTPSPIENGKNLTTSETKARSVAPDQMILPWKKKNWDLFVTKPVSTDEVWARIIGEEYSVSISIYIRHMDICSSFHIVNNSRMQWIR